MHSPIAMIGKMVASTTRFKRSIPKTPDVQAIDGRARVTNLITISCNCVQCNLVYKFNTYDC